MTRLFCVVCLAVAATAAQLPAAVIAPVEDVMTSGFFTGTNLVRGYAGDGRNVHRVSTDGAFGVSGAETIYVAFDPSDLAGFTAPVASAALTVESASGGFGADAGAGSPFTVSAHGVAADPLTTITDDTNPGGPTSWLDFFNGSILPAPPESLTVIDSFGAVSFDVTALVNDWLSGANTTPVIALTGKNHTAGGSFLHGFLNNSENPGATFLTITPVPEPGALLTAAAGLAVGVWVLRPLRTGCRNH